MASRRWYVTRRWSLAVLMALLAMVPVAALGIVSLRAASNSVRDRVADGQLAIGRALAEEAERDIGLVDERTAGIAVRAALPDLIEQGRAGEITTLLTDIVLDRPHLRRLALYDAEGRVLAAVPSQLPAVRSEGAATRIARTPIRVREDQALAVLAFHVPRSAGRLVAEIDLAHVVPAVEGTRFGIAGAASLTLADGTVLVSGEQDKRGTVLRDAVDVVDAGTEQRTIERFHSRSGGPGQLAAVTRLDNGWLLVVTQSRQEAFEPVDALRRSILLAAIATLLGGGLAALWIAGVLRRAQLDLAASERRARQITEAAHHAFVAIDEQGRVTEWNAAADAMFGWYGSEARGRRVRDLVIPERYHQRHDAWLEQLVADGPRDVALETTVQDRQGREFPVELSVAELPGDEGREYFAFLRDITERKQLERARRDARRKLELANEELRLAGELKNDFLAMASHELRTPLTSISGFAKTMRAMWAELGDRDKHRYVSIIDEQSDRLGRLVTDLLLLSRIEQGGLRVEPVPVDVGDAIERALRGLAIPVDVRVHCPEPMHVLVDADHLQQVLINLLSNAVKYGQPPIDVEVWCNSVDADADDTAGGFVSIAVEDHGNGVPPLFVERLFERFAQAPEHQSDLRAGAGLGLSIVAGLVEAHQGEVHYEQGRDGGARFVVRLPRSAG